MSGPKVFEKGRSEDGIAIIFAIMAIGGVVAAGFVGYLLSLGSGSVQDYNSIYVYETMTAIQSNVYTVWTNGSSVQSTASQLAGMNNCLGSSNCSSGTFFSTNPSDPIYLGGGTLYYGGGSTNGPYGFLSSGIPCTSATFPPSTKGALGAIGIGLSFIPGTCIISPKVKLYVTCPVGASGNCGPTPGPVYTATTSVTVAYIFPTPTTTPLIFNYTGQADLTTANPLPTPTTMGWQYGN